MNEIEKAEENLLFAGMALHLGHMGKDQVIRAFTEWLFDKSQGLDDILVKQKTITLAEKETIHAALKELVQQAGNKSKALASLGQTPGLVQDLAHLNDGDLEKTMETALILRQKKYQDPENSLPLNEESASTPTTAEANQRFQRQAFLDAGNLGEIFLARDCELNRIVVTKYIKPNRAGSALSQALFHLEGEVTGALEHPGIVPVYGLGRDNLGRLFYAMRFIQGEKLTRLISQYHQMPLFEISKRKEALTTLLLAFHSSCLTIEFAHQKGVLHCDLKPDNIMTGDFGEVFVVDWGMVIVQGKSSPRVKEVPMEPSSSLMRPSGTFDSFKPSATAASGLHKNQGGSRRSVGGTPAYMSPEQLHGTLHEDIKGIGPPADIYSLGAVLFQILTGRAPQLPKTEPKESQEAYFNRIMVGNLPKPREINPQISPHLEAIVLKAMAVKPENRYSSPRELANDVRRFLSDEPIEVYRESTLERGRRWIRKNETWAGVAAMLLLTLTLAALVFSFMKEIYNEELRVSEGIAKQNAFEAQEEKKRALANEKRAVASEKLAQERAELAIASVRQYANLIKENPELKNRPELEPLRKKLLEEPLRFFKELNQRLRQEKDSPLSAQKTLAIGNADLGELAFEIGLREDALRSFQEAVTLFELLLKELPSDREIQELLAESLSNLGLNFRELGKDTKAQEALAKAATHYESLVKQSPQNLKLKQKLGETLNHHAVTFYLEGKLTKAQELYEKSLEILEPLAKANPTDNKLLAALANVYNDFGYLFVKNIDWKQANEQFNKATDLLNGLVRAFPMVPDYQSDLANAHISRGNTFKNLRDFKQAETHYRLALQAHQKLVEGYPSVSEYQYGLALNHNNLGTFFINQLNLKEGLEQLQQGKKTVDALVKKNPSVQKFRDLQKAIDNSLKLFAP